jgi:hypothetical protein
MTQNKKEINFNELEITDNEILGDFISLRDYQTKSNNCVVKAYFRNLEEHLITHIESSEIVVGCVAWLTNESILDALSRQKGVGIIVQKEDFLRPDVKVQEGWKAKLQKMYECLKPFPEACSLAWQGVIGDLSYNNSQWPVILEPIRCLGIKKGAKENYPRMHNKFLVFCHYEEDNVTRRIKIEPYKIWTGSFNFTKNASLSFENAVVIIDSEIALAYYHEWEQLMALTEQLDWKSDWIVPEWGLGGIDSLRTDKF